MKNQAAFFLVFTAGLAMLCTSAQAATWQICRMDLRITDVLKQPSAQLQAQVLKVSPQPATAECPEQNTTITFVPETPNYQTMLPRRQWPAKGQSVRVEYRYLDGICKGDGHEHPCRIKHYSLVGR
ncbi:hypothetical protein ACCD10_00820 [Pseudomonas sp. Pseusp122]|uniref:hypothetical protein n=1 Tax=unclassified Pseudomonas TaxID=196821 RepID=UPI0039A6F12F